MNPNTMSQLVNAIQDDRLREAENYRVFKNSQRTVDRSGAIKMLELGLAMSVVISALIVGLSVAF